ncbi:MAG: hypothetical protein ACYDCH_04575 [Gaiellaceae bacterium]
MAGSVGMVSRHPGMSKLLLLAAEDMRQAATAARFLKGLRVETGETMTEDQYHLIHVLETGLVVTYMRPFSRSHSFEPLTRDEFVPTNWHALHEELKDLRNKVYAHIDDHPNRDASVTFGVASTGVHGYAFNVNTVGLRRERLDEIVSLCDEQAAKFGSVSLMRNMTGPDTPQAAG